jgi:pimeloyl-ACP methyl ester carboxylesterase
VDHLAEMKPRTPARPNAVGTRRVKTQPVGPPLDRLAGNDDPLVPRINSRLHAWLLRDARLHVFDDGHLFMLTRPRETARVIGAFLAEPAARPAR